MTTTTTTTTTPSPNFFIARQRQNQLLLINITYNNTKIYHYINNKNNKPGTFFIVVDFHGSESGLEIVEKDEDGDRNGEKQSEEKEDNDGLQSCKKGLLINDVTVG